VHLIKVQCFWHYFWC